MATGTQFKLSAQSAFNCHLAHVAGNVAGRTAVKRHKTRLGSDQNLTAKHFAAGKQGLQCLTDGPFRALTAVIARCVNDIDAAAHSVDQGCGVVVVGRIGGRTQVRADAKRTQGQLRSDVERIGGLAVAVARGKARSASFRAEVALADEF